MSCWRTLGLGVGLVSLLLGVTSGPAAAEGAPVDPPSCVAAQQNDGSVLVEWSEQEGFVVLRRNDHWLASPANGTYVDSSLAATDASDYAIRVWSRGTSVDVGCGSVAHDVVTGICDISIDGNRVTTSVSADLPASTTVYLLSNSGWIATAGPGDSHEHRYYDIEEADTFWFEGRVWSKGVYRDFSCGLVESHAGVLVELPIPESGSCEIGGQAVETIVPQPQCDALVDIYENGGGAEWGFSKGWATATDPCDWQRTTCGPGGIVGLRLVGIRADVPLPAAIGELDALRTLNASYSQFTALPAEIGQLDNLLELNLRSNPIREIPAELGNLGALVRLDLSSADLQVIPAELGNLQTLIELDLRRNDLVAVPASLGGLASLRKLDLSSNNIDLVPAEFGELVTLRSLRINDNNVAELPSEWANLTLSTFDASNNQLSGDVTDPVAAIVNNRRHDVLRISDQAGTACLLVSDATAVAVLDSLDPGWDDCSTRSAGNGD